MSDEVIAVIEAICDKIGIVVTDVADLIPAFARYGIATSSIRAVLCGICLIPIIIFIIVLARIDYKNFKIWIAYEEDRSHVRPKDVYVENIVGLAMMVFMWFPASMFTSSINNLIGWIVSPQAKMIYEIIDMIP